MEKAKKNDVLVMDQFDLWHKPKKLVMFEARFGWFHIGRTVNPNTPLVLENELDAYACEMCLPFTMISIPIWHGSNVCEPWTWETKERNEKGETEMSSPFAYALFWLQFGVYLLLYKKKVL